MTSLTIARPFFSNATKLQSKKVPEPAALGVTSRAIEEFHNKSMEGPTSCRTSPASEGCGSPLTLGQNS
jgi:hypothetical protein